VFRFDRRQLAQTLRSRRRALALTQAQVARRARTSQPAIARLEAARYAPRLEQLARLAAALDLDLEIRLSPRPARRKKEPSA
jgi:HTH-type transcriptional regulator / antitoxin HipB